MELNAKTIAQRKLEQHRQLGTESRLSIFEVANLMDALCSKAPEMPLIEFKISAN